MFEQLNNWFECDVVMFLVPRVACDCIADIAAAVHVSFRSDDVLPIRAPPSAAPKPKSTCRWLTCTCRFEQRPEQTLLLLKNERIPTVFGGARELRPGKSVICLHHLFFSSAPGEETHNKSSALGVCDHADTVEC